MQAVYDRVEATRCGEVKVASVPAIWSMTRLLMIISVSADARVSSVILSSSVALFVTFTAKVAFQLGQSALLNGKCTTFSVS